MWAPCLDSNAIMSAAVRRVAKRRTPLRNIVLLFAMCDRWRC